MKILALLLLILSCAHSSVINTPSEVSGQLEYFMTELDKMDCADEAQLMNESENEISPKTLCPKSIEKIALSPLGDFGTDQNDIMDYLNNYFYKPLALNMLKRHSLGEMLIDLVFLDPKLFLLHNVPPQDKFAPFRESVTDSFGALVSKSYDIENNRKEVSDLLVDILKRFHLYWNSLRMKNQFHRAKEDTKSVMREIVNTYTNRYNYLAETTKILSEKLKDAFFRFLQANKMLDVLNKNAPAVLARQFIRRYRTICEQLKDGKSLATGLVKEIYFMIKIAQCFHIVNYKLGLTEQSSISRFNTEIFLKIEAEFDIYKGMLSGGDNVTALRMIRDFTATLLLKCRHSIFVTFYYHHISELINNAPQYFEFDYRRLTKIYNEALDNLMMIPKSCVNFLALKNCALHESNKVIRYIGVKYGMKRSTSGWEIFEYLKMMLHLLFGEIDPLAYSNWTVFKQVYYQNLFAVTKTFQKHFLINDNHAMDDLENFVGAAVEKFKMEKSKEINDLGIIDILDRELYKEFINLKGEYNRQVPLESNPSAVSEVEKQMKNFIHVFFSKHKSQMNAQSVPVVKVIIDTVAEWAEYTLHKKATSIQVSNLVTPFVTNTATATFNSIPSNSKELVVPPQLMFHAPAILTRDFSQPEILNYKGTSQNIGQVQAEPQGKTGDKVPVMDSNFVQKNEEKVEKTNDDMRRIMTKYSEPVPLNTKHFETNHLEDVAIDGAHGGFKNV